MLVMCRTDSATKALTRGVGKPRWKPQGENGVFLDIRASTILALLLLLFSPRVSDVLANTNEVEIGRSPKRPVEVADSIEMTHLAVGYFQGELTGDQIPEFSPDGTKLAVVLRKGNLKQNTIDFSIWLWRASEVFQSPEPDVLITMSSSSNRAAIQNIRWFDDNETIAFSGEHPGETQQLYTLNTRTHALKKITNLLTNLITYSMTPKGDEFAYTAERPVKDLLDEKPKHEGFHVSTETLFDLVLGKREDTGDEDPDDRIFFQRRGEKSRSITFAGKLQPWRTTPFLSPDGEYVVISSRVLEIPEIWKEYTAPALKSELTMHVPHGEYSALERYVLVNTRSGETQVLLNSPVNMDELTNEVIWSPDSRSVTIAHVYLPLEETQSEERRSRQATRFSVEIRVPGGEYAVVTREDLNLRRFDKESKSLVFDGRMPHPRREVYFQERGEKWEEVAGVDSVTHRPEIFIEQGINTPPQFVAVDSKSNQRVVVASLNPQFQDLELAKVEEIKWKSAKGIEETGGLYYPFGYVRGNRYPLVIQTHGFSADIFQINGAFIGGPFAAQALAGEGIMVLQAGYNVQADPNVDNTSEEAPGETASFEGAIDSLDQKGLVDRSRVGIIGFSRSCYHVKYALTHSKYHFAAAAVVDGIDAGYFQYLLSSNNPSYGRRLVEDMNGGFPFGKDLQSWIQRSPGFSIDRVQAPLLIGAPNTRALFGEWEWFAALDRLGKPVDLIYFKNGDHPVQKPWQAEILQQGNVDWFCFWLKGEEDPDPTKAEQYKRWRELRKLQQQNSTKPQASFSPVN